MTKADFMEQYADIISSGYGGELTDWHKKELTELFNGMDKAVLEEWLVEMYHLDYGLEEGLGAEELNWTAEYLGKKAKISFE